MPTTAARFVSNLTRNTLALVLAGGRGSRLGSLTDWRTKPAVHFGGKYRIIDFTLSNCINSRIRRIAVLTQYKSHSLIQHIQQGWNFLSAEHGEFVDVIPAQQWTNEESWYRGTADAVMQSLDIIESYTPEYVLILSGDHIYNMDYGEMLAAHAKAGAKFTIACNTASLKEAREFGVMSVDESGRITGFEEKPDKPQAMPGNPEQALVSMGIYVFSMDYLRETLLVGAEQGRAAYDFGKDIIPHALNSGDFVQSYEFTNPANRGMKNYWRDVGTLDAFYQANLELIISDPPLDIYDTSWPVYTYQAQLPPAHFVGCASSCHVENTMVSGGCVIQRSSLDTSVLFSNVKVHENCTLTGVLALPGCEIGEGARLRNVILDNRCIIPPGMVIGEDPAEDARRFHITEGGIAVVNREVLGQKTRYMPSVHGSE